MSWVIPTRRKFPCCVFQICIFTNKYPNVKQLSWAIDYGEVITARTNVIYINIIYTYKGSHREGKVKFF